MKPILTLVCASWLYAQPQTNPPGLLLEESYLYTGANLTATCYSPAKLTTGQRARTPVAISAISKANPGVATSTGHGFAASARPTVTISGATGTGWVSGATTVNETFVATIIDADTFSIPVDTTGNGTLAGTVVFRTTAPRTTVAEWAVRKAAYDGSNNVIWRGWLAGSAGYQAKCSDAASATVEQQ